jgi:hypothetical protein
VQENKYATFSFWPYPDELMFAGSQPWPGADTNFSSALPPEDTQILDFIRNSKQSGEDNLKEGK